MSESNDKWKKELRGRKKNLPAHLFKPLDLGFDTARPISTEKQKELASQIQAMCIKERLDSLLDYYQISRNDSSCWLYLCVDIFEQLCDTFPSNTPKKKRGAVWDNKKLIELYYAVESLVRKPLSISSACLHLTINDPKWKHYKAKTLQNKYTLAKKYQFKNQKVSQQ